MKSLKDNPAVVIVTFMLTVLTISIIACSFSSSGETAVATTGNKSIVKPLPAVGSFDNLKKLLQTTSNNRIYRISEGAQAMPQQSVQADSVAVGATDFLSKTASREYSTTNIQVAGVDEADIVKTDGTYIYQVDNQRIVITQAYPATEMRVVNTIEFDDPEFSTTELYVDSAHLVVIGTSSTNQPWPQDLKVKTSIYPPYRNINSTLAKIYDIKDKNNVKMTREVEIEGSCVSSRKIGSSLYLAANRYIDYYCLEKGIDAAPAYRDTARGNSLIAIDYPAIHYFPGDIAPNYITVAGVSLDNKNAPADIQSYLGSGDNIYSSANNLYVAVSKAPYYQPVIMKPDTQSEPAPKTETTCVYKFSLGNGVIKYSGTGEVPGTILNQYSMDEYNGYFRIATTKGQMWRSDENTSQNNIYVLNENMQITGKLEGLAPGEKIYSTRFMGDRAYMVTFKNVDPLFVIDLKTPTSPKILGKLKIPGYSNYLHPYDENHIIGFGKDTIEMKGWDGSNQAYYQGMKIAVFDVTDVAHPVEVAQEIIGDRGTDSELLSNPKALLFDKDKNLLAFPVTVMKVNHPAGSNQPDANLEYGSFTFQGAYIYNIDLLKGLTLKGTITHLNADDYARSGDNWYESDKNIARIIYINNTLYTVSRNMIKANNLSDLKELKALPLQ